MYYHHYYSYGYHPVFVGVYHPIGLVTAFIVALILLSIIGWSGFFAVLAVMALLGGNIGAAIIFGVIAYFAHNRYRRW